MNETNLHSLAFMLNDLQVIKDDDGDLVLRGDETGSYIQYDWGTENWEAVVYDEEA